MPLVSDRKEQNEVMGAFRKALRREMHNLLGRPEILWQQMYNRLQWADGEGKGGPVTNTIEPEFEKRTLPGARLWMHNKCRTMESEALIMVLTGHTGPVRSCAISPDGKTLASASNDKTVRMWNVTTGKQISVYPCFGELNRCSFSPFGKTLAAGGGGGNVYILDLIGFEFRPFGIDSEADSLTEQDPERFPSKNKNQKEQEDVQQGFASSTCRCGKINPAVSKWCEKCGREVQ